MEMQQVRYFLAVAKTLNFTRAAEQCNVTQPALTRAVKILEAELGGELIRREGRLSHLTDLGERMLPMLKQCYESAQNAKAIAEKVKSGDLPSLAIGVSCAFDLAILTDILREMQRSFPSLQLRIRRGNSDDVAQWLKNGDIQLAFGGPFGEGWERLDSWLMFEEAFVLMACPEIEIEDAANNPHSIFLHSNLDEFHKLEDRLREAGFDGGTAHRIDSEQDIEALVNAGLGVAVLPESMSLSSRTQHVPCADFDLKRAVSLHSIAGRARTSEEAALFKLVRSTDWSMN